MNDLELVCKQKTELRKREIELQNMIIDLCFVIEMNNIETSIIDEAKELIGV